MMKKKKITHLLLAGTVLLAAGAAWAQSPASAKAAGNTEVLYDKPDQFTDISFDPRKREEALTELTRHFQAAVFALHHHVEKHQRDAFFARQYLLGFGAAGGMHETQGAAFEAKTGQCQFGDVVDVGFIVDKQDFPRR